MVLVFAAVFVVVALFEWQRRMEKVKHRRTHSDMYQPSPKVKPPTAEASEWPVALSEWSVAPSERSIAPSERSIAL